MTDDELHELLDAYADGEVSPEDRARVERRLAEDPACRAQLEEIRRTRQLVASLPRVPAPPGVLQNVKVRIHREEPSRRRAVVPRWVAATGWLAAAASLLLVIKIAPWERAQPRPPAPPAEKESGRQAPPAAPAVRAPAPTDDAVEDSRAKSGRRAPLEKKALQADFGTAAQEQAKSLAPATCDAKAPDTLSRGAPPGAKAPSADRGYAAGGAGGSQSGRPAPAPTGRTPHLAARCGRPKNTAQGGREPKDGVPEITYPCKDVATGIKAVARLAARHGGTIVGKAAHARKTGAVLVELPRDRIERFIAELAKPLRPSWNGKDKNRRRDQVRFLTLRTERRKASRKGVVRIRVRLQTKAAPPPPKP